MVRRIGKTEKGCEVKYFAGKFARGMSMLRTTIAPKMIKREKVREKYKNLMRATEEELNKKMNKYGDNRTVSHIYFTLNGYKTGMMKKQKGLVDILEKAKNYEKMSSKERQQHLKDLETMITRLEQIEASKGKSADFRNEVIEKLKNYRDNFSVFNNLKNNDEDTKNVEQELMKIKPLWSRVKEYKKCFDSAYKTITQLSNDYDAYHHMYWFASNARNLGMLLDLHKSKTKKISKLSQAIDNLIEQESKASLTRKQRKLLEKNKAKLEKLKEEAENKGIFISSELDFPSSEGNDFGIVHVRFNDLTKDAQDLIRKYESSTGMGLLSGTILTAGTALGAASYAINEKLARTSEANTKNTNRLREALSIIDKLKNPSGQQTGVPPTEEDQTIAPLPEESGLSPAKIERIPDELKFYLMGTVAAAGAAAVGGILLHRNYKERELAARFKMDAVEDPTRFVDTSRIKKNIQASSREPSAQTNAEEYTKRLLKALKKAGKHGEAYVSSEGVTFFLPPGKRIKVREL